MTLVILYRVLDFGRKDERTRIDVNLQIFLPKLAMSLINASDDYERHSLLSNQMPKFFSHLQRLAKERPTLARWGRSINIDELAELKIVDPKILIMIGALTNNATNIKVKLH